MQKERRGRRCVAVPRRAKWQQVAKELMRREETCFTSDVSCCDTCPPWWLPVINIITSCWGELTKVPGSATALSCAAPGLSVRGSERGPTCVCVFVKGMGRFYEDCAVNYSFRNVLLLACNPIVNALLVSLLRSPVVYANNWESVSPSVLKMCPMNDLRWLDKFIYLEISTRTLSLYREVITKKEIRMHF